MQPGFQKELGTRVPQVYRQVLCKDQRNGGCHVSFHVGGLKVGLKCLKNTENYYSDCFYLTEKLSILTSRGNQTMEINIWCAITLNQNTRALKVALEGAQLVDKKKRIFKLNESETAVPLKPNVHTTKSLLQLAEKIPARIECITVTHKQSRVSPRETLIIQLKELFNKCDLKWNEELVNEIPKHWEHHGDLILIPENSFTSEIWCCIGEKLWTTVASTIGFKRLAKMSVIKNNDFRSPKVMLLVGQDGWVTHVDNGIKYTFDVTKCMFSSGNISEKIRIGKLNCSRQVIVDLYAGIGYFVLPYLVRAKAAMVHACEWNPDAVEALQRTLRLNDVDAKCKVYAGDNRIEVSS